MTPPEAGFPEDQRDRVAAIYWQAFERKLGRLLGPREKALPFFARILDPAHAMTVCDDTGAVIGLAGFKTADGAFTDGGLRDLAHVYGWVGSLWRAPLLQLLDRELEPGILLMDGLAVSPEARGQGVGTLLLEAILDEARARNMRVVRLDVIDSNPRARALYERMGFRPVSTEHLGVLSGLFAFESATRMERPCD